MSDFAALASVFAIAIANLFLYGLYYKWMQDWANAIAFGVVRGIPVSIKYRRLVFTTSWLQSATMGIGFQGIFSVGYLTFARMASAPEVKLFAELYAFFSLSGVVAWVYISTLQYFHLRSILRELTRD